MKWLDNKYKIMLESVADECQEYIRRQVFDPRIVALPIRAYRSDTFGWSIDVLRLKRMPGRLQLWLDRFPNVGRPVLSVCYGHADLQRVKRVASAYANAPQECDLDSQDLGPLRDRGQVLAKPLPRRLFGRPIVESYQTSFFTIYLPDKVVTTNRRLRKEASRLCAMLTRSLSAVLEANSHRQRTYPTIENRQKVVQHIRRERSHRLALEAKIRDGFTCRICGFNFGDTYKDLGRGFAEAHHVVPLSILKKATPRDKKDLICVCSNCHSMLHRMDGNPNDIKRLRQLVKRTKGTMRER